jgi:hypothetical protein
MRLAFIYPFHEALPFNYNDGAWFCSAYLHDKRNNTTSSEWLAYHLSYIAPHIFTCLRIYDVKTPVSHEFRYAFFRISLNLHNTMKYWRKTKDHGSHPRCYPPCREAYSKTLAKDHLQVNGWYLLIAGSKWPWPMWMVYASTRSIVPHRNLWPLIIQPAEDWCGSGSGAPG